MAALMTKTIGRALRLFVMGYGAVYTAQLAESTYRDYQEKWYFPLMNAPPEDKLARIHEIVRMKGKEMASMTLGELAQDLKALGGVWRTLAEAERSNGVKRS